MPHTHELETLGSFVDTAETQRTFQNTTALKNYIDQHPQLSDLTMSMTDEVKKKLLFYVGNADQKTQEKLQTELDTLSSHLTNLSEKPTVLHRLLCEEIELSYLFLRHADTIYARHSANLSSLALRRMDTAQIRFLRALKTLANLQKLPQFLNVNLGTQQIALTS